MSRRIKRVQKKTDEPTYESFIFGEITGGLGNQLFVIFTTFGKGLDFNYKPEILTRGLTNRKAYFDTPLYSKILPAACRSNNVFNEGGRHHYLEIPKSKDLVLRGYFQSYKYFDKHFNKIVKMLEMDKLRDELKVRYQHYLNSDVSMHFRLGDYKRLQHCHPICGIEYYIEVLKKIPDGSKILYFYEKDDQDEIDMRILRLTTEYPNMKFVAIDTEIVDYHQMFIMSFMKTNIIANSSFSWWGAYFNDHPDKKVFYPSRWFGNSLKDKRVDDMFPSGWVQI